MSQLGASACALTPSLTPSGRHRSSASRGCRRPPDVRLWAKLEDRNPTGSIKDRAALFMIDAAEKDGAAVARRDDHRADVGQHRHLTRHGGQAARLLTGVRHAGEHLDRAPPAARDVGRVDRVLSRPPVGRTRPYASRRRWPPSIPEWVMLYQYGNPANARAHYETTGAGDPGRPAVDHSLRGGSWHHRHVDGLRAVPARARAGNPDHRGRAPVRRAGLRPAQSRRGLRARSSTTPRC